MKKLLFALMLLLPAVALTACDKDDDDDLDGGNGSVSGTVKVGSKSFTPKYSYLLDYEDNQIDIMCSDIDLSDFFNGRPMKKNISFVTFEHSRNKEVDEIYGGIGMHIDSSTEEFIYASKNSVCFEYDRYDSDCNPRGSSIEDNISGNTYTFEGKGLKAETWWEDDLSYDYGDLGMQDFSYSLKVNPVNMEDYVYSSRAVEVKVISDPEQVKRFRKLLRK